MGVEHGEWWVVGGHYHDIIVSSPGQGKCTFDIEKSSHIRDFSESNRRESEFEPKNSEDNCETLNAEGRALNTYWTFSTVIIAERFHFLVVLELQWTLRVICYIFKPLNTKFRSQKKRNLFPTFSFLDRFSASTEVSMEMAKNEIFSDSLFCFWNGNCWLCWDQQCL